MPIIWAEIKKELLLLLRDKAGLALLFVMPALLVVVMTYIQDAAFRVISNEKVQVLWVDQDKSKVSESIANKLENSGYFELIKTANKEILNESTAKQLLANGKYQVGVVLPQSFNKDFKQRIKGRVDSLLTNFGLGDSSAQKKLVNRQITVKLLFDPLTKATYKTGVSNGIIGLVNELETQYSFKVFQSKLGARFPYNPNGNQEQNLAPIINFKEEFVFKGGESALPTSVQHNIPAWTIFAIFFILVSFSQRIVEERLSGVNNRLLTLPINSSNILLGKTLSYLIISLLQLALILTLGFWFMPIIGLPTLTINGGTLSLFVFTIPVALASAGLALLIGTYAKTRDQAASFGSVVVIIFAALGGVWVPVFAMPEVLQRVSTLSPLNWALNGYYSIILRGASLSELILPTAFLVGLFAITFGLSILKRNKI